ncbi:MAG: TIGR04222 domain-containing membrane protein [Labedaea sp.]
MGDLLVWLASGLLVAAASALWLPISPRGDEDLWPGEIALLRRGVKGAMRTALAVLYEQGVIESGGRTGLRRTKRPMPPGGDPLGRAVYGAMHTPAGLRALAARPGVRRVLATMTEGLVAAGLIAGRPRRLLGRVLLIAAGALAVTRLAAGHLSEGGRVLLVVAIIAGIGLWMLSRITIAGRRTLSSVRHAHARLLATWSSGEEAGILVTIGVALGKERALEAAGFSVADLAKVTEIGWQVQIGEGQWGYGGVGGDDAGFTR